MDYQKIYMSIIHKRTVIEKLQKGNMVTELHHIIPRSISRNDNKENLVRLTAREHFICHLLLIKIYKNQPENYKKMLAAIHCISYYDGKYNKLNSRVYEKLRMEIRKVLSEAAKRPRKRKRTRKEMEEFRKSKNINKTRIQCRYCTLKFKNNNAVRNHERFCKQNPNRKDSPFVKFNKDGHTIWNKGLTIKDSRIKKFFDTVKSGYRSDRIVNYLKGKHMSEEHKKNISKGMRKNNSI